jgi:hypothetical protein
MPGVPEEEAFVRACTHENGGKKGYTPGASSSSAHFKIQSCTIVTCTQAQRQKNSKFPQVEREENGDKALADVSEDTFAWRIFLVV